MKNKTYLTLLLVFSANVFSAELIPLTKYMETADSNDYFTLETIAKRCSAMNLAMTRWAQEGDELFKTATANYTIWFLFANQARGLKYPDDDPSVYGKNITSSIINIMEEVDALFKRNQDMSGSIFAGTFLETDFQVCAMMREKLLGDESDQ